MKRALLLFLIAVSSYAQNTQGNNQANIGGLLIASNFAQWTVPQGNQGGYTWSSPDFCKVSFAGATFNAFSVGTPVEIVDTGNPANNETVTVNNFASTSSQCSVYVSPTHAHNSFYFRSATAGLGEALAFAGQRAYQIILTPDWGKLGGITSTITSSSGNTNITISDQRTAQIVPYSWNGSIWVAGSFGGGGTPGGATTNVQFNNSSAFGGDSTFTFNNSTKQVGVSSLLTPNISSNGALTIASNGQTHLNDITVYGGAAIDNTLSARINNVIYVDGVQGAGIGVPSVAWASSTFYPYCTEVSHSGGNYLLAAPAGDAVTTPGTNKAVWYPIPNAAVPTQLDCAFYTAASQVGNHLGAAIRLGAGLYGTGVGLLEPVVTTAGDPTVSIFGSGRGVTTIQQSTSNGDGLAVLEQPDTSTGYAFATFIWEDFTIDAQLFAPAVIGVYAAQEFTMRNILAENATDGSDHYIEFGDASNTADGWTFEADIENVDLNRSAGVGSGAVIPAATISGGVPSFTISNGGSGYGADTKVVLGGTSAFGNPCSSVGTTTPTIVSGAITAIVTSATGCVAPLYAIVYPGPNISYGYKFSNASDSKNISHMTDGGVGAVAGMYIGSNATALSIYKYHPISTLKGVVNYGNVSFGSLQCDTMFQYCFDNEAGGGVVNLYDPFFEGYSGQTGMRDYYFSIVNGTQGYNMPAAFNIYGERCGGTASNAGYAHFDTGLGVVDSTVGSDSAFLPAYVTDHNPQYCNNFFQNPYVPTGDVITQDFSIGNGAVGNLWNFNLGTGPLSGGGAGSQVLNLNQANSASTSTLGEYQWNFQNPTPATSGNNYGSPIVGLCGTSWTGSASSALCVTHQLTFASGASPASTFHTGGASVYTWDNPITLPNGSTATTQTSADNTTKVATDQFVQTAVAGAGSPAATNAVYVSTSCGSQSNCYTVKGDVKVVNDASWSNAGTTITTQSGDPVFACPSSSYPCSSSGTGSDVGKIEFGTANCGTSNGYINCHLYVPQGTISSITSAHVAVVSVAATAASGPTVSWFAWGTQDDSTAIQNAVTQLVSLGGGDLNLPCNQMFVGAAPMMVTATHQYPINIKGCASSYLIPLPNFTYTSCAAAGLTTTQTGCIFSDWYTNRQTGGFLQQTPTNFDFISKLTVWGLGQDGTSLTSRSTAIAGASLYLDNVQVIGWNWNQTSIPDDTACTYDLSSGYLVNDFAWSSGYCGLSVEADSVTETPTTIFGGQYGNPLAGMYASNAGGALTNNGTHIVSYGSDPGAVFFSGAGPADWRSTHDYPALITLNASGGPTHAAVYLDTDFPVGTQTIGLEDVEGIVYTKGTSFGTTTTTGSNSYLYDQGGNFWGTTSINASSHIYGAYSTVGNNPTTANYTASTGWGTSGAAGNGISTVAGGIRRNYFTVTATGTPTANPTVVYTFPTNGNAYLQTPQCQVIASGGNGAALQVLITAASTTAITMEMLGTPVATDTYQYIISCGLNE